MNQNERKAAELIERFKDAETPWSEEQIAIADELTSLLQVLGCKSDEMDIYVTIGYAPKNNGEKILRTLLKS